MTAVPVNLPGNYVAFQLDAKKKPPAKDLEILRLGTVNYIQKKLKSKFPSLQKLQLDFLSSEFGTKKPTPEFDLYIEAKATVFFDCRDPPEVADVFEIYVSCFNEEYLEKAIRKLMTAPSVVHAIEVRARKVGSGTPAGGVTAPRFYMAFVSQPEPTAPPSQTEKDKLLQNSNTVFHQLMTKEFESDFDNLSNLRITKTEIGLDAGKPEAKYNVYIEFEAVAKFHQNVPEPMDFFRAISVPPPSFIPRHVHPIGGFFKNCKELVLRCIFLDSPEMPEDPPKVEEEEEQEAAEPDEGDPEEKEKEPKNEKERPKIKLDLGFYVALVVQDLDALPKPDRLELFDFLMQEFFTDTLKEHFPDKFASLTLEPNNPRYQASIPLPRFNLLHQYYATVECHQPPPEGDDVLKRILYCNLSDLYGKISGLPSPYNDMVEFTMGRALEKQATDEAYGGVLDDRAERKAAEEKRRREEEARKAEEERKRKEEEARKAGEERRRKEEEARKAAAEKRRTEEAERRRKEEEARKAAEEKRRKEQVARKAEEERKRKEEAARKAEEERKRKEKAERKRKEDEARKAVEEQRRKEEEARKAAEEKKRKEEDAKAAAAERAAAEKAAADKRKAQDEAARREAEERARKEKEKKEAEARAKAKAKEVEKAKPAKPTAVEEEPSTPVGTADVFIAFTLPNCKEEPSEKDYDALAASTQAFYAKHLKAKFKTFKSVNVGVSKACYGQNKPDNRYHVYIEWDIVARFDESGGYVPNRYELCTTLVQIDMMAYMTKHVQPLRNTPFADLRGMFTEQRNKN